jgi:hypothetical protein
MLMINIREYCFGTLSYMGMNDENDITKYIELFQQNVLQSQDSELEQKTFSSMFGEIIFGLYEGNVCETQKQFISLPAGTSCEDIMYNSSKYGFTVLLSTYFTQLRFIKNNMDYLYLYGDQNGYVYNMTLTGTEYFYRNLPLTEEGLKDYFALHPICVFNSEPFLNVIKAYRYIVRGCISGLFDTFVTEIGHYIIEHQIIMNLVLGVFFLLVFGAYCGIWIRYEKKINNAIYKTKNMITIIPVAILANIPSIFKVLEINSMINSNIEKDGADTPAPNPYLPGYKKSMLGANGNKGDGDKGGDGNQNGNNNNEGKSGHNQQHHEETPGANDK